MYLNKAEYFLLHDRGWVIFRADDFDKFLKKVFMHHLQMEPLATVLHTRFQYLPTE